MLKTSSTISRLENSSDPFEHESYMYFNVIILYWPHMVILIYVRVAEFQAGNTCHLDIPAEVDSYHCLYPLEQRPSNPMHKSSLFDYRTSVYRATNSKDGLAYCLKRVHGRVLSFSTVIRLLAFSYSGNTRCCSL